MRALRRDAQGQALVMGLVLLGVLAITVLGAYQLSRLLHQKSRLSAVADAAAYSAAVVQSRTLNQLAYANRAALGHQMAMAHWITLASWARYGDAQSKQLARRNPPSYLIASFFGPRQGAAYLSSQGAAGADAQTQWGSGALARAFAEHDDWLRTQFTAVQQTWLAQLPERRWHVMQEVIALGQGQYTFTLDSLLHDAWPRLVQAPSATDPQRFLRWVEQAQQQFGFLQPRDNTAHALLPSEWRCPWLRHQLRRRGATEREGLSGWRAHDTQSFHALRSNRWIGCYFREYPMGGGTIAHDAAAGKAHHADAPDDFSEIDFWRWVERYAQWDLLTGQDNPLANSWARRQQIQWRGGAIPAYADIRAQHPEDSLSFTIDVSAAALQSRAFSAGPAWPMSASASAESYYARWQARDDGRIELPSLFQPFWHARLVARPGPDAPAVAPQAGGAR